MKANVQSEANKSILAGLQSIQFGNGGIDWQIVMWFCPAMDGVHENAVSDVGKLSMLKLGSPRS